jgi:hypothetical protein
MRTLRSGRNLHEHQKTKNLVASLSRYVQQYAAVASADNKTALDIGFKRLREVVNDIPEILKVTQAEDIVRALNLHYKARIEEPIIEERDEPREQGPRLQFPKVEDAFVPQSFHVLRHTGKSRRLEDESTWEGLERRNDLGAFLLSYLSSPYSMESPLVILGHPGSGKSLLTKILSAQLMSRHYTAFRVPLREVDSDAGIVDQIGEHIGSITNIHLDPWARVSGAFRNNPPLVILDGYDELLQASGKVFSGYLKDVQNFQRNEAEQDRPVRVIVTSRITLIDKATVPQGSTIIRLLEFDEPQRERWISIWNKTNARYFKDAKVKPFELPSGADSSTEKVLSLAEQPLLLLMLALYDSEGNKLRDIKSLDRTVLYDSLLRRFVRRERGKKKEFENLSEIERRKEVDRDMQRLGVASIGMYNRRKLHILSSELDADIKFFKLERDVAVADGRPLTQAELLLGSFFFVHKAKAVRKAGAPEHHEESAAFEFLHNTFGEFLTADFIIHQALLEVNELAALAQNDALKARLEGKLREADGFSQSWFACLVYTPLFTRPVVLEMVREWIGHELKGERLSRQDFLYHLDTIVLNQVKRILSKREMPSIMRREAPQEGTVAPFGDHPLLGHLAIYSINLILLRSIVGNEPFVFDESLIASHEDGARPWDQLTHLWRSWFALDNLNGVTAILHSARSGTGVSVSSKDSFRVSESRNRLETFLNVSNSLGDSLSSGLAGFLLYEPSRDDPKQIDEIEHRLSDEGISLALPVAIKRLLTAEGNEAAIEPERFLVEGVRALETAIESDHPRELEEIAFSIRRGLHRRLRHAPLHEWRFEFARSFGEILHPRLIILVTERNPWAGLSLIQLAVDIGMDNYLTRSEFMEELMHRLIGRGELMLLADREPGWASAVLGLVRRIGGWRWSRRHPKFFPLEEILDPERLALLARQSPAETAATIQLALELGDERWMDRHGERFIEHIVDDRVIEPLIGRSPDAVRFLLDVLHRGGSTRWLTDRGEEIFDRGLPPEYVEQLLQWRPNEAIHLLRLAANFAPLWLHHYGQNLFERAFPEEYMDELAATNLKVALELMQLAQQIGARRWLEKHQDHFIHGAVSRRSLVKLIERDPRLAVDLIHAIQASRRREGPKGGWERATAEALDPDALRELVERNPDAAMTFIELARDSVGDRWIRHISRFLFERKPDECIAKLIERNPEAALGLLTLAFESREGEWLEHYGNAVVRESFRRAPIERLLVTRATAVASALRFAHEFEPQEAVAEISSAFKSLAEQRRGRELLVDRLPLAAVPHLRWLAEKEGNEALRVLMAESLDSI